MADRIPRRVAAEVDALSRDVQKALAAHLRLLTEFGPDLRRPAVDALKGAGSQI